LFNLGDQTRIQELELFVMAEQRRALAAVLELGDVSPIAAAAFALGFIDGSTTVARLPGVQGGDWHAAHVTPNSAIRGPTPTTTNRKPTAVFVFPSAAGHMNPSLPISRGLVSCGWNVEYLATSQFRTAIEDTGATYFDRDKVFKDTGIADVTEAVKATFKEYKDPAAQQWALNFGSIGTELMLPVYIEWFRSRAGEEL
jgi:hypothetical protein